MEYQYHSHGNPFEPNLASSFEDPFSRNERTPAIPAQARHKQNKERRLIIEKEKQREKQQILQKRKQKQDNVQKILKQRQEARENAKLIFGNTQKTFGHKFEEQYWRKAQDIQEKIHECRSRADQYRTMYKKKLHDNRQDKQKNVQMRRDLRERFQKDKSLNYHLAEWRSYEKKIADKYRGESKNPNRMYEQLSRKQQALRQLIDKSRHLPENDRLSAPLSTDPRSINIKTVTKQDSSAQQMAQSRQKNNPVYIVHEISSFGLSKSIKTPQKILKQMKKFLQSHTMLKDVCKDEELVPKFEQYLSQKVQDHA